MPTALERKNRPGREPGRHGAALERVLNIPNISDNFNRLGTLPHLLNKPLKCCLIGLVNKLDRLEESDMHRSLIGCATRLLNELSRFDQGGQ
jgi:hypothetical protein